MSRALVVLGLTLGSLGDPRPAPLAPPPGASQDAEAKLASARDELRRAEETVAKLEAALCQVYSGFEGWLAEAADPEYDRRFTEAVTAAFTDVSKATERLADLTQRAKATAELRQRLAAALEPLAPSFARALVAQRLADALAPQVGTETDVAEASRKAVRDFQAKWLDPKVPPHELWNRGWFKDLPAARDYADARAKVASAGERVSRIEHPERYHPAHANAPEGMVFVLGGTYTLGPNEGYDIDGDKRKAPYAAAVKSFFMDKTEVTNKQYHDFLRSIPRADAQARAPLGWEKAAREGYAVYPAGTANYPVTGISYEDAAHYASWAKKRLPTEEEWEVAARGPRSNRYPWGPDYEAKRANDVNAEFGGPAQVGSFPRDESHFGVLDMAGNVMEWTSSLEKGKEAPVRLDSNVNVIIRGGSYDRDPKKCAATYRWAWPGKTTRVANLGFRCVKDAF